MQQEPNVIKLEQTSEQQGGEQHLKTLAIRVDEKLHAQLRFIAQLRGSSITDEIRQAIENRIASAHDDPELVVRAEQVRDEIEREAASRSAAIAGFLGKPAVSTSAEQQPDGTVKAQGNRRPQDK